MEIRDTIKINTNGNRPKMRLVNDEAMKVKDTFTPSEGLKTREYKPEYAYGKLVSSCGGVFSAKWLEKGMHEKEICQIRDQLGIHVSRLGKTPENMKTDEVLTELPEYSFGEIRSSCGYHADVYWHMNMTENQAKKFAKKNKINLYTPGGKKVPLDDVKPEPKTREYKPDYSYGRMYQSCGVFKYVDLEVHENSLHAKEICQIRDQLGIHIRGLGKTPDSMKTDEVLTGLPPYQYGKLGWSCGNYADVKWHMTMTKKQAKKFSKKYNVPLK